MSSSKWALADIIGRAITVIERYSLPGVPGEQVMTLSLIGPPVSGDASCRDDLVALLQQQWDAHPIGGQLRESADRVRVAQEQLTTALRAIARRKLDLEEAKSAPADSSQAETIAAIVGSIRKQESRLPAIRQGISALMADHDALLKQGETLLKQWVGAHTSQLAERYDREMKEAVARLAEVAGEELSTIATLRLRYLEAWGPAASFTSHVREVIEPFAIQAEASVSPHRTTTAIGHSSTMIEQAAPRPAPSNPGNAPALPVPSGAAHFAHPGLIGMAHSVGMHGHVPVFRNSEPPTRKPTSTPPSEDLPLEGEQEPVEVGSPSPGQADLEPVVAATATEVMSNKRKAKR